MKTMNSIFRLPFPNRYSELAEYIEKSAVKELEMLYPELISEIFNNNMQTNWGLRHLKADTSAFNAVYNFLQPNGPMFKLCYKLLLDCHLRYEFPYQYLPMVIRNRLEDSNDTSFYKQRILARSKTRTGNCIYLNAFEYYMFHFAYHLINPALQLPDENSLEWDTVYLRLAEAYLDYFLPCTSSLVYPLLNQSTSSVTTQHTIGSISPLNKTMSIFREDVLKNMSPSPPQFTRTKTSSSAEIWRSELVGTLFIDFWLSGCNNEVVNGTIFASCRLWSIDALPTREQLRCVRLLLRHLHYFSNYILSEDCAMNDLKREIISSNRRTIYSFFSFVMMQLPLDSSYKLLLEAWFTYIQPWRYTNPYLKHTKYKENKSNIDRRWFSFIAENLVVYTHLYYVVLTRLSRCDLTTYKISSMFYRLMQVFSQPQLLKYIEEVEKYLEEGMQGGINSWNSIIRQNIYMVEKIDFRYDGFYSPNHHLQVLEFYKQIEDSIPILNNRKTQVQADDDPGLFKWFKEQFSGNIRYSSTDEIQKIEFYLAQTLQKLRMVHQIEASPTSTSYAGPNLSESFNSFSSVDSVDGNLSTDSASPLRATQHCGSSSPGTGSSEIYWDAKTSVSNVVDPKERRKLALNLTYEGDPDLYPIRSWESKFLVRVFYYICLWINTQFRRDLGRIYYEDSILGGVARQVLCAPKPMYYFEKRSTPDGFSRRVYTTLPPRISLRWCASYYYTIFVLTFYVIAKVFEFSFFNCSLAFVTLYVLYLMMSSIFNPVPVPIPENETFPSSPGSASSR